MAQRTEVSSKLSRLRPRQLHGLIHRVAATINTSPAGTIDKEHVCHLNFLRDAQTFIILRHAIKHADIGLLKRCINQMIILFHGTSK